jgi:hypothetical protein
MPATEKLLRGKKRTIAGVGVREPFASEDAFFKKHPEVGGMATSDNKIILNPHSSLSDDEKEAVGTNEAARVHMRMSKKFKPDFDLTEEQEGNLRGTTYSKASAQDRKSTIAARILSGDPSGGKPTLEQLDFVGRLKDKMFPKSKLGKTMGE